MWLSAAKGLQLITTMSTIELARLRESCVKGHHVYRSQFIIGAIFNCEHEASNAHSTWAIVVKKPTGEVVGHIPDSLAEVLLYCPYSPLGKWRASNVKSLDFVEEQLEVYGCKEVGWLFPALIFSWGKIKQAYHPQQIEEDSKEEKPGGQNHPGDGSEAQQN